MTCTTLLAAIHAQGLAYCGLSGGMVLVSVVALALAFRLRDEAQAITAIVGVLILLLGLILFGAALGDVVAPEARLMRDGFCMPVLR